MTLTFLHDLQDILPPCILRHLLTYTSYISSAHPHGILPRLLPRPTIRHLSSYIANLELRGQLHFTTSSTIKKRKMSRPEELPRSASPQKRRAGSAPLDSDQDTIQDVDMPSAPPSATNHTDALIVDADPVEGGEDMQEGDPDSPRDDTSITAQADGNDEDFPDIVGLGMDQASVEETQPGSELEGVTLAADSPGGNVAPEQGPADLEKEQDLDAGESKAQTQNGSSTSNTDEATDSDAKTVDTAATSASTDGQAKNCKSRRLTDCSPAAC